MGTENVKLGVCSVTFNAVDLGLTKGGVEVEVTTDTYKVTVDQYGETAINENVMARNVSVTVPLAETTLDNLVAIMPGATLITDGITPTKKRVDITTGVGTDLLSLAQKLVLHPINAGASVAEDIILPKAMTAGAINFAYRVDDVRVFNVVFNGYPDANDIVLSMGDETATP